MSPFLRDPARPPILAICRPDHRKNIPALVEVFGRSRSLRRDHNLVLVLGCRRDPRQLERPQCELFEQIDRFEPRSRQQAAEDQGPFKVSYRLAESLSQSEPEPPTDPGILPLTASKTEALRHVALRGQRRVFFSQRPQAWGLLEGWNTIVSSGRPGGAAA